MMKLLNNLILTVLLAAGLAVSAGAKAQAPPVFSQAELDQMLAPIALYPDTVLSHVLIAATYPLEVVQAARWSRHNPALKGEEAVYAVEHMDWDPSVKALAAFPDLLQRMDEDLSWTQALGDAFLLQEEQVLDSVQYLREQAYAQGHLRSNEYVRVVREPQYIYIEPATPRVVYVPYYDPRVVYVGWRWPAYPPVYWHHPPGFRVSVGFHWGIGFHVAPAHFYFSSFHWPRRQLVVVHHHHHHHHRPRQVFHSSREVAHYSGASRWQHDPKHRRGVNYREGVDEGRFTRSTSEAAPARVTAARTAERTQSAGSRTATRQNESTANARDSRRADAVRGTQPASGNTAARGRTGDTARTQPQARDRAQASGTAPAQQRADAARTEARRSTPAANPAQEARQAPRAAVQRDSSVERSAPAVRSAAESRPAPAAPRQQGSSVERAAPARVQQSAAPRPSAAPSPQRSQSVPAQDRSRESAPAPQRSQPAPARNRGREAANTQATRAPAAAAPGRTEARSVQPQPAAPAPRAAPNPAQSRQSPAQAPSSPAAQRPERAAQPEARENQSAQRDRAPRGNSRNR